MLASQTAFAQRDAARSVRPTWAFAAKIAFALVLVLTATFALVRTEVLAGGERLLGNSDPILFQQ